MSHYIQSIGRAAQVLTVLSEGGRLMGVTEIANKAKLGKSTVHRILASLGQARLVRLDPASRQYSLGYGLLQLSAGLLSGSDVSLRALPYLRDLRQKTGETVTLNIREHDHRVVVERLDTSHEIRYVAEIGRPLPFHIGAGGKAILAFMDETEILKLPEIAKMTMTDVQHLIRELEEIRAVGSSYTLGERYAGAGSISGPIFNHAGVVTASVNVLSLESRLQPETVVEFRRLVKETAMAVSKELGWQAPGTRPQRVRESLRAESRRTNLG